MVAAVPEDSLFETRAPGNITSMGGSLEDSTVLVTGAGRGLGRAICLRLAGHGAKVVATDIDEELVVATADLVGEQNGRCLPVHLDVTDDAGIEHVFAAVDQLHGHLDILVNNAAIDLTRPVVELDPDAWRAIIEVNLTGPFLAAREFLRHAAEHERGGKIVNIVCTASKRAWADASAYHASKWGLLGLSRALHIEARACGVGVTAVIAGGMRTPFLLDRAPDIDPDTLQEPDAVAEAVVFAVTRPHGTVIPEIMVLPEGETSWP